MGRSKLIHWLRQSGAALLFLVGLSIILDQVFPPPLHKAEAVSVMVTDRSGKALRAFPTERGGWRFSADLDQIDPAFLDALIRVEDKRFYKHWGVDWFGLTRAFLDSARAGRVVSGGSTITMQTARLLEPRKRTVGSKLIEIVRAHQIEARLTKDEILELYLTLAPYGGNLEGVRAASWSYFGHEANRLTDDEIALLIALPQSPEMRRPDRYPEHAADARDWVAEKLSRYGVYSNQRWDEVRSASIKSTRQNFPADAWHGSDKALSDGQYKDVRSTLDSQLQSEIEAIAKRRAEHAGDEVQVAAVIVDIPTRAVRAIAGSASRQREGGWLDLTAQARSPGSTLKPFIYATAFDDGIAAPDTRISDLPKRFASYQPENFDRSFRGDVRISEALQHSLNVPAVLMLDKLGPQRFADNLAMAGARPRVNGSAEKRAGLALALGGAGLTVQELAIIYAALGDGGVAKPLVWRAEEEEASQADPGHYLMSASSADKILDILRAAQTPEGRMPGRLTAHAPDVAFKTGTSYGYRDAWAAGVSGDIAIVVWVGRADGAPRTGKTGRSDALPILFEMTDRASYHLGRTGERSRRVLSKDQFKSSGARADFSSRQLKAPQILFPPHNTELWAGDVGGKSARSFVLSGRGEGALRWFVDGKPSERDAAGAPVWLPKRPGFYRVSAVDENGRSSTSRVRVLMADDR